MLEGREFLLGVNNYLQMYRRFQRQFVVTQTILQMGQVNERIATGMHLGAAEFLLDGQLMVLVILRQRDPMLRFLFCSS